MLARFIKVIHQQSTLSRGDLLFLVHGRFQRIDLLIEADLRDSGTSKLSSKLLLGLFELCTQLRQATVHRRLCISATGAFSIHILQRLRQILPRLRQVLRCLFQILNPINKRLLNGCQLFTQWHTDSSVNLFQCAGPKLLDQEVCNSPFAQRYLRLLRREAARQPGVPELHVARDAARIAPLTDTQDHRSQRGYPTSGKSIADGQVVVFARLEFVPRRRSPGRNFFFNRAGQILRTRC